MRIMTILLATLVVMSAPVSASVCATDVVPAASLLFPFASFDYNQPHGGDTTIITITNLSPQAQIVYVTLWTDFAVPILDFNIVLSGYDQQQVNLRDVLLYGRLPVTLQEAHSEAEGARDSGPVSSISSLSPPVAELAAPVATTALGDRCSPDAQAYPGRYTQLIPDRMLDLFESWLRSSQDQTFLVSEDCTDPLADPFSPQQPRWYNRRTGADPTWFYLTADVVDRCEREFPDSANFWRPFDDSPAGLARYDNVLTGDVIWISGASSTAAPAVHLEADRDLAAVTATSDADAPVSFYHRYSILKGNPTDAREPLPTAWGMRYYLGDGDATPRTRIRAWKGSTEREWLPDMVFSPRRESPDTIVASDCLAYTYYAWDQDENVYSHEFDSCGSGTGWPLTPPPVCPNQFPLATQEVDAAELDLPDESGWLMFVWPPSNFVGDAAALSPDRYQTWMGTMHTAWGTHADFIPGTVLANANCWPDQVMPDLGIDYDYVPAK